MNVTIEVTQQHIDAGNPNKCSSCPIALAVNNCLAPGLHSGVGQSGIVIFVGGHSRCNLMPPRSAREFISRIDEPDTRHLAKPFAFTLDVPDEHTHLFNPAT